MKVVAKAAEAAVQEAAEAAEGVRARPTLTAA